MSRTLFAAIALTIAGSVAAGTEPYFIPLTRSASVSEPNSTAELSSPWQVPAGVTQVNLTSMSEIEADMTQSVQRVPAGRSSSMWDMLAFDPSGNFIFTPHETPVGAGLSRYDINRDENQLLFAGDLGGATGDWSNDYAAFDPARWTPNGTVIVGEEWAGNGRIVEVLNPLADPADIELRVLDGVARVAHEGINFSAKRPNRVIYFVDEWNSGSIYKLVLSKPGDYAAGGQTFVLRVDAYDGDASENWNEPSNAAATRTGLASWIPVTDRRGNPLTSVDPFRDGPTNDPRTNADTRGGRPAADEVGGTPYGRPEDMEAGFLGKGKGREVIYFTATSEQSVYSVEMMQGGKKAIVRLFAGPDTPTNLGFAPTSGTISSPDNLAQDENGNIYIIEDKPNSDSVGGDVWFARDVDGDGVAESLDHFLSIQVDGSEATGMAWRPGHPSQFAIVVQHPDSTDLGAVPGGFGDAIWLMDVKDAVNPD